MSAKLCEHSSKPTRSVQDVGFDLGYSTSSAFIAMFQRQGALADMRLLCPFAQRPVIAGLGLQRFEHPF